MSKENNHELTQLIAESGQWLIRLNDARYQADIEEYFKLKKLIDKSEVLTVAERQKFHEVFKANSPIDHLKAKRLQLSESYDHFVRSQDHFLPLSAENKALIESAAVALKHLWDAQIHLSRSKPHWQEINSWDTEKNQENRPVNARDQRKATALYASIMTRHELAQGNPTRRYLDAVTKLPDAKTNKKLAALRNKIEPEILAHELEEICHYLYQNIGQQRLLKSKDLPEVKSVNDQMAQYVKQTIIGAASLEKRVQAIQLFVEVIQICRQQRNYFGAEIIRAPFQSEELYKLIRQDELWQRLPVNIRDNLQSLDAFSRKEELEEMKGLLQIGVIDFIPSVSIIKTMTGNKKEFEFLAEGDQKKPEDVVSASKKPSTVEKLIAIACSHTDKITEPQLLKRIKPVEPTVAQAPKTELAEGSFGQILLEQLAKGEVSAINSILEIAGQLSLEKQKEFVEAYCKAFAPQIDLSELQKNYSAYVRDEKTEKALRQQFEAQRGNIYAQINQLKAKYKTETNKAAKKQIKKSIGELNGQLKELNKNFRQKGKLSRLYGRLTGSTAGHDGLYDNSKKPAVKDALRKIYAQMGPDKYTPEQMGQWQELLKQLCRSPQGYIGDLFSAPLVKFAGKEPSLLEMRKAFGGGIKISNCLYLSPKSGGANDPGQFGGNYLLCYQTEDGKIHSQVVFFKQATDKGFANHRENIAEVMAGHIMNGLVGDRAASTIFAMPDAVPGELKSADPESVYVGSFFFKAFSDFHTEAHKAVNQPANKRGKAAYGGQSINNPILGNPHFQSGFIELAKSFDVTHFSSALMSNLLVGNYQIHTQNGGTAQVAGKLEPVTFDFGGAFRRLFVTKNFKTKEVAGQFSKSVHPYKTVGRKYDTCYLLAFPVEVRESKEFILGIDQVAGFSSTALRQNVQETVEYAVRYYGKAAFIENFAKHLDTTGRDLDLSTGSLDDKVTATTEFLYYRLAARQLSLHSFSLELKLKSPDFEYKKLVDENPIYFKYKSFNNPDQRMQAIRNDADKMIEILNKINELAGKHAVVLAKLPELQEFLKYASKKYALDDPEDQDIMIQALNQAHRAIVLEDVLQKLPESSETAAIRKEIEQLKISTPLRNLEVESAHAVSRSEIKTAETLTAQGVQKLYSLVKKKIANKELAFDAQGIATVHFANTALDEDVRRSFPNGLENGIDIHIFSKDFIQHPPIHYLLQQRAQSLCNAVKKMAGVDIVYSIPSRRIEQIIADSKGNAQLLQAAVKTAMNEVIGDVLNHSFAKYRQLNPLVEDTAEEFTKFSQKIVAAAAHIRSAASILTFNEGSQHFSFDEGTQTTSHDRGLEKGCANLSWIRDGVFDEKQCTVTSSAVKHASLPPIDAIGDADKVDCLAVTYQHLLEVIKKMAVVRQHGRPPEDVEKPLTIDFNYALLTTSVGDQQKQYQAYLYIKRAIQALDGAELKLHLGGKGPTTVRVQSSVMNAGINALQKFQNLTHTGKQTRERENRKAYLRLTEAVREVSVTSIFSENLAFNQAAADLRFAVFSSATEELAIKDEAYAAAVKKLNAITEEFRQMWHLYNHAAPGSMDREMIKETLNNLRKQIKNENNLLDQQWHKPIETAQKRAYEHNRSKVEQALAYLASVPGREHIKHLQAQPDAKPLTALTIFVLKAHLDALYYSGQYLQPKGAAVFNAYYLAVQRLTGMMASTGCKSANDRTMVMRLMLAVLSHDLGSSVLPVEFDRLVEKMSADVMANSAMFSCINDNGGTPKIYVDRPLEGTNNFSYLANLDIGSSADYGKFASQKLVEQDKLRKFYQPSPVPSSLPVTPVVERRPAAVNASGLFGRKAQKPVFSALEKWSQHILRQEPENLYSHRREEMERVRDRLETERNMAVAFLRQPNLSEKDTAALRTAVAELTNRLDTMQSAFLSK